MSLESGAFLLAALTSLALAVAVLVRRPRLRLQWSAAIGMLGLAIESLAAFMLVVTSETPDERLMWLKIVQIGGLLLTVPWMVFVVQLGRSRDSTLSRPWQAALTGYAGLTVGVCAGVAVFPTFQIAELSGRFYAARVDTMGRLALIVEVLGTVGILTGLEAALRASKRDARWRTKHLLLGLGGLFLVRFYLASHSLLLNVVFASYATSGAAALIIANLAVAVSVARNRLVRTELRVTRNLVYRSVLAGVLGLYLFGVGVLGWVLQRLGVADDFFWQTVVVFVSALALAALLLSEDVRWRIKRFIGEQFYQSRYDYRVHWITFTKRLASLLTLDELAPQVLGAVADAIGAAQGALYLANDRPGRYHLVAAIGIDHRPDLLEVPAPLLSRLGEAPLPLSGGSADQRWLDARLAAEFQEGVAVALQWRGAITGVMLIGAERTGAPYRSEDLQFLTTVAEQVAGAIVTARLSETAAQSREFEAFHRLTSFVIHDLKNSISALSMLSENALRNFDDPEFQRDAIKTLSRTVDKMKALLGKLSSGGDASALRLRPVDLPAIVVDAVSTLKTAPSVRIVQDLAATPSVLADPEALHQVVQNLVTNAIESLDGGGTVTLKTYERDGQAVCSVSDTGCGISQEFLRNSLFTPFRSTKKGGWGIGLYQVKTIVEAHRGTIEVTSQEGVGTTFVVSLPRERHGHI